MKIFCFSLIFAFLSSAHAETPSDNRIASVYFSEDFINEQIRAHAKSKLVTDLKLSLDPDHSQIFMRGQLQVPVEELRAINLDPQLGAFRFQVTIRPETTKEGYLILEFPLAETFFYPANSRNPVQDRVIVPVQMLSLGLASMRGYLAALSGDFSGFDRRTKKIKAQIKALDQVLRAEKNPDALAEFQNQRDALRLQLAAVPIERKQLQGVSKEVEHILGFTGEKELNLNDELGARRNALILKIKLSQLAPYLVGVELGGLRIFHDKKNGASQKYLAIDINSQLMANLTKTTSEEKSAREEMHVLPSLIVRLNQSLLESVAVANAEKKAMGSKLRDLQIQLKDDGLHVSGRWRAFFFSIPFDTIVDFVTTGVDVFEVRVRDLTVAGLDLEFLTKFVLQSMEKRLDTAMHGICTFQYVGEEKDHSRALQVSVKTDRLVPAFPDLHLVAVDVRDHELLLKVGHL
jgi:hypothetical protein